MRQSQSNRRGRGRGRKAQNPLTRNYESNGPDVKIRGTAAHISEKYLSLARDALASGDIVRHENYLQHSEHYNRIIMAAQQANSEANEANVAQTSDHEDDQRADANGARQKKNQRRRRDGKKADRGQKNQPEAQANGHADHAANGKDDSRGNAGPESQGGAKVETSSKERDARSHATSADDAAA